MKRKILFQKYFIALCMIIGCFIGIPSMTNSVQAQSNVKTTLKKTRKISLPCKNNSWENEYEYSFTFTTTKRMVFMVPITISTIDKISSGGLTIQLMDEFGYLIQNDKCSLKGYDIEDEYTSWFYNDDLIVSPGTYTYIFKNTSNTDLEVVFSVIGYSKLASKASVKSKVFVRGGNWVKIGKIGEGLPLSTKVKVSKRNIVTDFDVQKDGSVYVWGENKGTVKVTFQLKTGRKYTTIVTVKPGDPNMYARLYDYNTRDNYFIVKVKNKGKKTITILRNGGRVENVDYRSFDRNLKSSSSVKIAPGKTKYIRFYVRGRVTWYDYEDYTLIAKFKYDGATYEWHVWDDDSVFKHDKKWYSTYWDEYNYNEWY
ncbi:MAG: hypothetical protein MR380_10660 [Lachnospiraceae bacterium]|nr:hypothetical protein [Lachnospiraceae bacterium]